MRRLLTVALALGVFGFSWFLRYNEPEGGFAGLLDDQYFYVARGWQMLYGELPDRDFVDVGAPLNYALSAAAQLLVARGTWSEILLSVTMLSAAAALSFYAAATASGSLIAAGIAALFHIALFPRLYNYHKLITYALAIPAAWAVIDRPSLLSRFVVAAITVVSLLWRHDHGVFVGLFVAVTWLSSSHSWQRKKRELLLYVGFVLLLVLPYLIYLALNGGIVTHFVTANAWSMRDRARAPLRWPEFAFADGGLAAPWTLVAANPVTWLFHVLIALPLAALALVAWSGNAWRPEWPHARAKIAAVAVLALVLDVGFLRGALGARLADVAVPHTVIAAWLLAVAAKLVIGRRAATGTRAGYEPPLVARIAVSSAIVVTFTLTAVAQTPAMIAGLRDSHIGLDPGAVVGRAQEITARFRETWPLDRWSSPDSEGPMRLVFYLETCTRPTDRVFISQYLPQVAPLARRAFAGGQTDLRPGFFSTDADQRLFLERIRHQTVPVLIVAPEHEYAGFRSEFPLVDAYFSRDYDAIGDRDLGGGLRVGVRVRRDRLPMSRYERLDLPCYR